MIATGIRKIVGILVFSLVKFQAWLQRLVSGCLGCAHSAHSKVPGLAISEQNQSCVIPISTTVTSTTITTATIISITAIAVTSITIITILTILKTLLPLPLLLLYYHYDYYYYMPPSGGMNSKQARACLESCTRGTHLPHRAIIVLVILIGTMVIAVIIIIRIIAIVILVIVDMEI